MKISMFTHNPLWKACPPICRTAWLPAFGTEKALRAFLEKNGTLCTVVATWKCVACGGYHAKTVAPDPSGHTSGTTRTQKHRQD